MNAATKSKITILILDKLIIAIIIAFVTWYIDSKNKKLDSELMTQREILLGNIKNDYEKALKEMDYKFQQQQIKQQQDFDFQLEKFKINSNYNSDLKKSKIEKQKEAFYRLTAIKLPFGQIIRTHIEAKLLSEFYERRFQLFTNNPKDLEDAKYQNERGISLIKDISNLQKELFETLGLIQSNFILDKELESAVNSLYNFQAIDVSPFPLSFKNTEELDIFLKRQSDLIDPLIRKEYTTKIEEILIILRKRLNRNSFAKR